MGNNCNCDASEEPREMQITTNIEGKVKHQVPLMQENKPVVEDPQMFCVEFETLATLNPPLAKNLFFQSLARGYLSRTSVKQSMEAQLSIALIQSLSKRYLTSRFFSTLLEENLFGKYRILPGSIDEKTIEPISALEEQLQESLPLQKIINETMVRLAKGVYYQGQWKNKKKHGYGIIVEKDNSKYIGKFKNDQKSGEGWLFWPNGDFYSGNFKKNQIHGEGEIKCSDGRVISGVFHTGKLAGSAKEIWQNGCTYEGNFDNLEKSGYGVLTIPFHSTYSGEFENNTLNGKGFLKFEDGKSYNGEWKNGRMHGFGKFKWPNGKYYVGNYVEDKKHGIGKLVYPDKKMYNGEWKDDLQHGKATYTFFDLKKKRMRTMNSLWENGMRVEWLKKDGSYY